MRGLIAGLLVFSGMTSAFAQETPAILNDPAETVSLTKAVIQRLNPSYETVVDVLNGDVYQGVSGNMFTFESRELPIASLRLGASTGMAMYSGISLDLPGLSQRFVPKAVADPVTLAPLDSAWSLVGKYARVGMIGGYSWDHDDPVFGFTAGAAVTF